MYNDNGSLNQAVQIDPFNVSNVFANYTFRGESALRGTKVRFAVNNLLDKHNMSAWSRRARRVICRQREIR
jgi:outer membrane receptor protein involved in Fe transport